MQLVTSVYELTTKFPPDERFGLTQQLRRAAVSVPSNIAEGCSRESQADFRRFIEIALGSAMEVRCQLSIADRLGFELPPNAYQGVDGLVRALAAFGKTLRD